MIIILNIAKGTTNVERDMLSRCEVEVVEDKKNCTFDRPAENQKMVKK